MEEQAHNRSFFIGVTIGALIGGCIAALMSMQNTSEEAEYAIEHGLELKHRTEDIVQRTQYVANEAIARVQANSEVAQSNVTTNNHMTG